MLRDAVEIVVKVEFNQFLKETVFVLLPPGLYCSRDALVFGFVFIDLVFLTRVLTVGKVNC